MLRVTFDLSAKLAVFFILFAGVANAEVPKPFSPTRFTVTVEGKGSDVVMIPGLASSSEVWRPEAERLKGKYRLHLIQVAGFAGSDKSANAEAPIVEPLVAELAAYIRANKLKQPAVIGHSLGGLIGLMLADRHPDLLSKLMIVDAFPFSGLMFGPQTTVETIKTQAVAMRDSLIAGTQQSYAASQPFQMRRLVKSKGAEAEKAIAAASASDREVVARALYDDFTTDLRSDLATVKTPIVLLYPFDAAMGMPQSAVDNLYENAYSQLPNKRLVRIEDSFHFIQIDQPEAFHREVVKFLETH
jgi:pimeloyl-ACP methyl ester carboxylesterase